MSKFKPDSFTLTFNVFLDILNMSLKWDFTPHKMTNSSDSHKASCPVVTTLIKHTVYIVTQITYIFAIRPCTPAVFALSTRIWAVQNGRCTSKHWHSHKDGIKKCHGKLNLTCRCRSKQIYPFPISWSAEYNTTVLTFKCITDGAV